MRFARVHLRNVYRVFLYDPSASPVEPGGALFIPPQGAGRIDNPAHYDVLYAGDSPAGACGEVFYRGAQRLRWTSDMLTIRRFPGMTRAIATYELRDDPPIIDLDDPHRLIEFGLRPSQVIVRDIAVSQAWALQIFQSSRFSGIEWWSFNDPRWKSMGIWDHDTIESFSVDVLTIDHPALAEAAARLDVRIEK